MRKRLETREKQHGKKDAIHLQYPATPFLSKLMSKHDMAYTPANWQFP